MTYPATSPSPSPSPPPTSTPSTPYTLVTTIAQGGMGYVELCVRREGRFLRWCARKRLHEQLRSDSAFRSMFMDEGRLAGLVRHPNAVGVLDVGEDHDGPFLIMDFVEGVSLSRVIAEAAAAGRSIPMQAAVRICLEAAMGLHAAHEVRSEDGTILRLVHRDVSPQNILIGFDGTVRVTDFGIAKALGNTSRTSVGVLKGNMGYLSPEQLRFEEPDRRSDFFSLGVTLHEMLSGLRLYPNTDGFDGTRRILTEPPPDIGDVRSDVPPELVELLLELLAKERESRPATAAEIAGRLEGILAVLIAEEGSLTVADYMDQYFAEQRQGQRTFLSDQLKRVEAGAVTSSRSLPVTLASVTRPALPVEAASARRVGWRTWLGVTAAAAAAAVAAGVIFGAGGASVGRARGVEAAQARPSAMAAPSAPPSTTSSAAPAPPAAAARADEARPAVAGARPVAMLAKTPADARRRDAAPAVRRKPARRTAALRPRAAAATKDPGGRNDLDVPLFTRWQ